jgi:major membrane immunogen (membrane-anchored lipoprotein)
MSLVHSTPTSTIKLDDSIDDSFNFNIEFQDDKLLVSKSEIKKKQRKLKDSNEQPKEKLIETETTSWQIYFRVLYCSLILEFE